MWYTDGNELFLDNGESVLFRVEVEEWHDLSPQKPQLQQSEEEIAVERKSPYSLIVSRSDVLCIELRLMCPGLYDRFGLRTSAVVERRGRARFIAMIQSMHGCPVPLCVQPEN